MGITLIGEGVALKRLPEMVQQNTNKSIGICYLPASLKTAYLYIYIPQAGEKGSRLDIPADCQKADMQVTVCAKELHESDEAKILKQSRARFWGDSFGMCQLQSMGIDTKFALHLFCTVTEVKRPEPFSSLDSSLVRRQTL